MPVAEPPVSLPVPGLPLEPLIPKIPFEAPLSGLRLRLPIAQLAASLGLLQSLQGEWIGTGFNLIWRPNFAPIGGVPSDHFLELNLTQEITKLDFIGAPIPNRGLAQPDQTLFGLHYLQQVSDLVTRGALHIEPGIWVNMTDPTTQPKVAPAVARLSTIPHGNALVAQGEAANFPGGPVFTPANVNPFPIGGGPQILPLFPELNLAVPTSFRSSPIPPPPGLPPAMAPAVFQNVVHNPNLMLSNAIAGQKILNTTVITVATSASIPSFTVANKPAPVVTPNGEGGVENIAFLNSAAGTPPVPVAPHNLPNANAAELFATFWIEEVQNPLGAGTFLQLQYTQTVYLNFAGLTWPHVSVATLVKSSVV